VSEKDAANKSAAVNFGVVGAADCTGRFTVGEYGFCGTQEPVCIALQSLAETKG
jgi:hypothetical protein